MEPSHQKRQPVLAVAVATVLATGVVSLSTVHADIAVVTATRTPIDAIDETQAKALWEGTVDRIGPVRLNVSDRSDPGIRDAFYHLVVQKTRGQIKAIRAKRAFQFGIAPPPSFPDDPSVLNWVRSGDNRLGYVDAAAVDDSTKVLLMIETNQQDGRP